MTDQELQREKSKLDMKGDTLTKKDLPNFMQKAGYNNLLSEIRVGGLGEAINRILDNTGKIYVNEVLKWAHIEKNGKALIHDIETRFKEFTLIEHYSNSYTFKVSRDNNSIGYVFGMMEDLKRRYSIQEYSASQTTLEQIFNMFARQAQNNKILARAKKNN